MCDSVSGSTAGSAAKGQREASWKKYVDRSATGDQAALAALYDESCHLVHAVALRVLGDTADAEEVTLDVYTQIWRTAASYDTARGSVMAWLVTLARSRAIDRVRARAARVRCEHPIPDFVEFRADTATPEADVETAQKRRNVLAALSTLSPEQREVVHLAFFSGLTHSELAERLGQPLGTVKTRIRSGMMKLRGQLEQYA